MGINFIIIKIGTWIIFKIFLLFDKISFPWPCNAHDIRYQESKLNAHVWILLDISKKKLFTELQDKIVALQTQVEKFHNVDYAEDTIYRFQHILAFLIDTGLTCVRYVPVIQADIHARTTFRLYMSPVSSILISDGTKWEQDWITTKRVGNKKSI